MKSFLVFLIFLVFSCSREKCNDNINVIQKYNTLDEMIVLYEIDQGVFGNYVELIICDKNKSIREKISLRSEDSKPKLDSVKGNNIYISYIYKSSTNENEFIIPYDNVVLGEGLLKPNSLKYKYFFSGKFVKE